MSAIMADDQQLLLWRENRGDDDGNKISDFPHKLISYVNNNQFLCDRGIFNKGFVFSTLHHHPPSQPSPFSKIIDLDSETPIAANQELIGKIKSIMKWIVFCPGQFLVQFWKVIEIGGRRLLTTQDQPFGLSTTHEGLCSYRLISLNYQFYVDGESEADLGLPGRVFRHRRPESSPNVQYYSCKEYPQRDHDVISNVRRSWALPVLESSGQCCVGVLELVAAAEPKYPFINLIDGIYKRVEEVGLRSSETCNHLYNKHQRWPDKYLFMKMLSNKKKYEDEALKDALAEIKKVLIEVCQSHDLPLAQTWVPCRLCNPAVAGGSFNVSCREHLMLRFDIACCRDKDKLPFVDVCTLHSLGKGQGVVGKAFSSHNLVFYKDITQFSIIEYPLVHYACKYGLTGCFSICLRSGHTGDNVYVLEFFLRPSNTEGGDPKIALVPLLTTLKQHFRSFKVASGEELGEELSVEVIDSSKDDKLDSFEISQIARSPDMMKNGGEMDYLDLSDQQLMEEDVIDTRNNVVLNTQINNIVVTSSQQKCITNSSQRQQRKAGIPISSEDIQQHVGMKLDDAAASLHDSQSTLKRACSEYAITGWSCRKRNKDNLALSNKFVQGVAQEQIQESSQPPISDPPCKQDLATTYTKAHSMATQDTSIVTIKAKHGENFIKFKFPVLSGMVEFQQEVAKRLHLEDGTYSVKYQDDGNNWILIACDEELRDYISKSKSLGKNIVTMSLEPNYNKFVQGVAQEQIRESCQPPISDPPRKQGLATTCAKVHSMATQDIVTIKAKHGENFIKFKLSVLSGMVEFQQEVAKRLQLEDGTYSVKYQDDGNNWILIACDEELRDYISKSKSLGKNIVTMSLEPNYDELVQGVSQEQIQESSQPPIFDPPRKQDLATTCAKVHSLATQDTSTVTIKAKHGENFIKFKLPVLSGMVEFQQEVAKRLQLEDGTYSVKYQDDGNNWILIACDEELQDYISKSKSLGKNIVTMSLEPNYDKLVQDAAQEQIRESSQPPISDPPHKQDLATTCAKVHSLATQDTSTVTIKAKHGENFIKFKLPVLSGMVEFQQEVAKRLQLEDGTYSVKYQDDGDNWILIACDEELRDYISKSKSLGKNIVTMSLEPNCDILVQYAAQEQIRESSQPPISDPPRKQDLATTCTKVHSLATQDTSTVTIKAKHGENFIKFKLPVLSGMVEFQQEVAKRLQLEDGTYSVKYQDDGDNWILIACDEELRDYISKSKSLGKNIVTMSLEPNCDILVQDAAQEQIRESSQPPISDPPRKEDLATTCAKVHSMATQDTSIVTIKAKHGENFIKFKLPVLSGMVEFQQEVARRLHLDDGTYSVKYQDDGNNWILIARDEELRDYISKSKSLGKNIVTMLLQPITSCPP